MGFNLEFKELIKIVLVAAELFHKDERAGGQIYITKLIVAFRSFCKRT
jgi:hypothetical protein